MNTKLNTPLTIVLVILCCVCIAFSVYSSKKFSKRLPVNSKVAEPLTLLAVSKLSRRDSLVNFSLGYLGKPYIYGACTKDGFDCSGFVYYVFKNFNITVPRSSSEYINYGKTVEIAAVKKGDILVFLSPTRNEIGHLGIVTTANGMNSEFIHAATGKEMKVIITKLNTEHYTRRFVKAIQVL